MINPRVGSGGNFWLCPEGHAEARRFKHGEVIGAIPNRQKSPWP